MGLISICINVDTRDGFQEENTEVINSFHGCRSEDFLIDGVLNKIKFFEGFETEVILLVDEHNNIPKSILSRLQEITNTLIVRKHTSEHAFNDWNYWRCLSMANGNYVCHFDQDTVAFTSSTECIINLLDLLNNYSFVSYPSYWSPKAVEDASFGNRTWASTRFFICKRESLKLDELANCIREPEWGYRKYGDSPRRCNWTEHFLSLINNDSVFYPPMDIEKYAIFCWKNYRRGIFKELNNLSYDAIKKFISDNKGIQYPCDLAI